MIPHLIAHPSRPELLHFEYDFDARTTTLRPHDVVDGALVARPTRSIDHLLRFPIARGDHWYLAVMDVREFGQPAYVERWAWDSLERLDRYLIEHPKFGLTALGVSPDCSMAVVDRFFPIDGDQLGAKIVSLPDMKPLGGMFINAGMSSPVFGPGGLVAMVHYDQDACTANVYRLAGGEAKEVGTMASDQIVTDFDRACVELLSEDLLAVWSVQGWDFGGMVGVYDIHSGKARFVSATDSGTALEVEDEEGFSFKIGNTDLAMLVEDDRIIVGTVGGIATIEVAGGAVALNPPPEWQQKKCRNRSERERQDTGQ
jgi:hypothetical protein